MPPVIDPRLCTICGTCYDICPQDCFALQDDAPPTVPYGHECWHCAACVIDCPDDAIHLELPLHMHIVPSPALFGDPGPEGAEDLKKAAAWSRSIIVEEG
jgi:adenylylsulfate reductase subunit B